ncbi:hypothetical protein PG984_016423 [Apiospora sp. TS-2023a]
MPLPGRTSRHVSPPQSGANPASLNFGPDAKIGLPCIGNGQNSGFSIPSIVLAEVATLPGPTVSFNRSSASASPTVASSPSMASTPPSSAECSPERPPLPVARKICF